MLAHEQRRPHKERTSQREAKERENKQTKIICFKCRNPDTKQMSVAQNLHQQSRMPVKHKKFRFSPPEDWQSPKVLGDGALTVDPLLICAESLIDLRR